MEFLSGAVRKKNVFPVVNGKPSVYSCTLCALEPQYVISVFAYHMLLDRLCLFKGGGGGFENSRFEIKFSVSLCYHNSSYRIREQFLSNKRLVDNFLFEIHSNIYFMWFYFIYFLHHLAFTYLVSNGAFHL